MIRNNTRTSEKTKTPADKGRTYYRQPYEPIPLVPLSNGREKNFDLSKGKYCLNYKYNLKLFYMLLLNIKSTGTT